MSSKDDYQHLFNLSRQAKVLQSISTLLSWDQETYMPPAGAPMRAEQLKTMAALIHHARTSSALRSTLENLIDLNSGKVKSEHLNPEQQTALKQWRRDYLIESALPDWFVEEFAKLTSHSLAAWKVARAENKFNHFAPYLETIIEMNKRKAEFLKFKEVPYDALLDLYEPEATTASTAKLFQEIQNPLVELLKKISQRPQPDTSFLKTPVAEDLQMQFGKVILAAMGYPFEKGNLSLSTHPFCEALHPNDCRITTRIDPKDFMSHLKVVLHEGGHALYEMQLPAEQFGSPLAEPISMAIHESQSRFWECYIGLSRPFWSYYYPLVQKEYGLSLDHISLEDFWKAINQVKPSFIRVEADELTYPLHIILRFEIEQALINGKMSVKDIPDAWNAKSKELLGITPPTDALGCLQDVHWSIGAFGYFPTYLMGNAYAASMLSAFKKEYPNWEEQVAQGDLLFIKEWLRRQVHQFGRLYSSQELLKQINGGTDFSAQPYLDYLETKYTQVYHL